MIVSYNWLQDYIKEPLPEPAELARKLTVHSYEVESVEEKDGDYILDIDVLPNRAGDSLSHIGIAREVAMLFSLTLNEPLATYTSGSFSSSNLVKITTDPVVRRAAKRVARNITLGPTPSFIAKRLEAVGQRLINNVVDITNFVMLETGQPVHAFDFDRIQGGLEIRFAREGEKITLLDDVEYTLSPDVLVIADSEEPLDVAGVKGGKDSGISEETSTVLLSVCSFQPSVVRRSSQRLGLRTDASKRFENDISPVMVEKAMDRLSLLLVEYANAEVSEDTVEVYPRREREYITGCSRNYVNSLLGTSISEEEMDEILTRLSFPFEKVNPRERIVTRAQELLGKPYMRGASVTYDAPDIFDCSSFTSYLYSRAGISIPRMSVDQYLFGESINESELSPGDLVFSNTGEGKIHYEGIEYRRGERVEEGVDHVGVYLGNGEVLHASKKNEGGIGSEKIAESSSFKTVVGYRRIAGVDEERYAISVPYYRRDLRREADIAEEIGRVYGYGEISESTDALKELPPVQKNALFTLSNRIRDFLADRDFREVYTYSFVDKGSIEVKNPIAEDKKYLRESLEIGLRRALAFNERSKILFGDTLSIFEIGTVFSKDREFTMLGILSEEKGTSLEALREFEITFDVTLPRLSEDDGLVLADLTEAAKTYMEEDDSFDYVSTRTFVTPSAYPYVHRDIAMWVPENVASEDVLDVIREKGGALLVSARLFDTFEKEERISYAFRLAFQSHERTLSDTEVNEVMDNVSRAIRDKGWEVR